MANPTLLDVARRVDPNGKIDKIAEILTQTNEILLDMPWIEGNLPTGHKTTVRTGLPQPTWRMLNYGVQPAKSTTAQVTDTTGMLETYAEIDKSLADLNGNSAQFRLSEDRAFLEGMNQALCQTVMYGDTTINPEKFVGLAPRYSTLNAGVPSSANVIDAGGAAARTSVWLIVWGENTAHAIYPKGSKAGFQHNDLGEQTLYDANGGRYQGYRTHYKWDCGLTVRDYRYIVRIANVDTTALTSNAAAGADLIDLMSQALERVENLNMGQPAFYANRTIRSFLRRQIANKVAGSTLTMEHVAGKPVMAFGEVPVRRVDQITNNETAVA